ncbi:cell wall-binding repeat-containing protein [Salana multivorans]
MKSSRALRLSIACAAAAGLTLSLASAATAAPADPSPTPSPSASVPELPGPATPDPVKVRISGGDRYETALKVSAYQKPGVKAVFLASGQDFPDALSASAAAAKLDAPLLLTRANALPKGVLDEIKRLAPEKIYVVGGSGSIGGAVYEEVSAVAPTQRLSGATRYETTLAVADAVFDTAETAILATGRTFPDALSASGAAGRLGAPVILIDGTQSAVSEAALETLEELEVTKVAVAGGDGSVSNAIVGQLNGLSYTVARHGGTNRYETSQKINEAYFTEASTPIAFLASGEDFPDALAGSAWAGRIDAPLTITETACLSKAADATFDTLKPGVLAILGGTGSVSKDAEDGKVCGVPAPDNDTPQGTGGTTP